ncbi:hypothetical protein F2P56_002064 [Juglans regia]|uniref:Uncharacterized protein LOC109000435 n=2 Tax=Juglans regia TaxID=51240 RepID=A0A2I4FMF6_JUGRE|nr:uncharacterized protein LOC109000435 [Juglans regia]KAF5481413.1 hypothetical protein F2P56_002064 [Juglans regia]
MTTPTGYHSGMDHGPWKKRNEGSSWGKRPVQGHYIRDCPMQLGSNKATIPPPQRSEVPARGSNLRPTAPARVLALTPGEVEDRNDVITGMTHSFVSTAYSRFCTLETERLKHKLVVATPIENSVVCSEILPGCPLSIEGRLMLEDLLVFHMVGFDVIFGMGWLASYHASIDCSKKEVVFRPPNESEFRFTGSKVRLVPPIISVIQIPVVRDYPEVFPEDLSGPPEREVEFAIELVPGMTPLSKAPYRMVPSELVELKE